MELRLDAGRAGQAIRGLYRAAQAVARRLPARKPGGGAPRPGPVPLFGEDPVYLPIWADVTLHNAPVRAPFAPRTVVFPSPVRPPGLRVCAFCREDQLRALEERGEFDKCLPYRAMRTEYPSFAQRRALAREYEVFCCEASCFMKLAQYGGKALLRARRPVCLPGSILAADRELVRRCFTLCPVAKHRCGVCLGVLRYREEGDPDPEELAGLLRNVEELQGALDRVVPAGAPNVKLVELRLDMSFLRELGRGGEGGEGEGAEAGAKAGAKVAAKAGTDPAPRGAPLPSDLDPELRVPKILIYNSVLEPGARVIDQAPVREQDPLDQALEELRAVAEEEGLYDGESLHSSYQGSEGEAEDAEGEDGGEEGEEAAEEGGEAGEREPGAGGKGPARAAAPARPAR